MGLIACVHISTADVLIYKIKVSGSEIGGGTITKSAVGGYFVIDADTGDIAEIGTVPAQGRFHVNYPTNFVLIQASGGLTKKYTAFSVATANFGTLNGQGLNTALKTGTVTAWTAPKVFQVTATSIDDSANTIDQGKGTFIYDQVDTINANTIDFGDLTDTVNALVQVLLNAGFTEN